MKMVKILVAVAICAQVASQVRASVYVDTETSAKYAFTSNNSSSDNDPYTTATSLSYNSAYSSISGGVLSYSQLPTSSASAYVLTFTVTAATGYRIDLNYDGSENISLKAIPTVQNVLNYIVAVSCDGGDYINVASVSSLSGTATSSYNFDKLSGVSVNDLSSVNFRIYAWSSDGSGASFDNISLGDTIISTVPEPTTCALPLFGLVFIGGTVGRWGWRRFSHPAQTV